MPDPRVPLVAVEVSGAVATIMLNRPERLNALDTEMHAVLRAAFDRVAEGDIRAVILTGAGRGFCAGAFLGERAAMFERGETPDLRASLEATYNPLIRRIAALPIPVIAAVNGVAAGAGASLALACDIVIASDAARFQFSFVKVGLGLDAGASWTLPRLMGPTRAMALTLTGDPIDAATAERFGMVWKVVPADVLREEARTLAQRLADGPRAALAAIKQSLRAGQVSLDEALNAERDVQGALATTPDYREAVVAFAARRTPRFQ